MGWASYHIEKLQRGETVQFRPHGQSMVPRIRSGQLCTVAPYGEGTPRVGDIVLCSCGGHQYLHLISAVNNEQYQISNNRNHVNGWVTARSIYGRCILVE